MASGLAKLGVGLTVLTSPGFGSAARNMPGPVGDYLRSSVKTTEDFGKSLIAYDTFKKGNVAEGLGEAVGNIGTFFIPGVGEAGAAVKGAATASPKLDRSGKKVGSVPAQKAVVFDIGLRYRNGSYQLTGYKTET